VKEDTAVKLVNALTAVQPTFAVIRRRRWASREVVGEREREKFEYGRRGGSVKVEGVEEIRKFGGQAGLFV